MFEAAVQASFSAAHRLRGYKGKCENMHGHNWKVEASVAVKTLNKQGIAVDFSDLKDILGGILSGLDHKVLNDLGYFKKINPTSENIARYIYDRFKAQSLKLKTVKVWETDTSCAAYYE